MINCTNLAIPREILPAITLVVLACWTLPAFADSGDATWSATLYPFRTIGCWSEGTVAGCDYNLYPNTFVYDDETYKIDRVILTTKQHLYLRLDSTIPGAQNSTLVVGSTPLQFDASATKYPRWYNTGMDWSDVDTVSLSLWISQEPVMQPVPVLVNGPPTGANKTITMRADGAYAFATSDFGFSDSDTGDSLAKIQITTLQSAGSLKLDGTQVTLNQEIQVAQLSGLVFEPAPDANGSPYATFQFKVSDGDTYSSQANTFTINVNSVNTPPTGANKTITMQEDSALTTFRVSDFGFSDPDAGDSFKKIQITTLQSAGSLKLGPASLPRVPCDGPWGACVQNVTRTQVTLNQEIQVAQLSGLVFEPAPDANGSPYATFQFKVSDGDTYSSQANTFTINVTPVNDAPTGADKTFTIQEDSTLTLAASDFGFSDSDTGDSLAKIQITTLQSAGSLKLDGTQVTLNQEIQVAQLSGLVFEPVSGASGSPYTTFQFKVSDGDTYSSQSNTITINVNSVNSPPTGANKAFTIQEDSTRTFAASDFGFSDPDAGDSLAKIQITALQSAGSLKLDGTQVTLNQEIQASAISGLVFEPVSGASGSPYATFQFKVSDGDTYSSQANTITINVTPVNSPPTGANKAFTIQEDSTRTFAASDFGFSDPDAGDSLAKIQITALQSAGSLKLDGTQVTLNQEIQASAISGLVFEPVSGASGSPYATFQFKVSDGDTYSSQANTITINVTPVNDPPTNVNDVADETAPVITLQGSSQMTIPVGSTYSEPGYTATDNHDGDLTGNVTVTGRVSYCLPLPLPAGCDVAASTPVTGTVDTARVGTYYLYYNVADSSGNAAVQQVRTVNVVDETAPVITLEGSSQMTISNNTVYVDPGYTAFDYYDGDLTSIVTVTGTVDATQAGTYYLYYNVADSSGNAAVQQVRTVNVEVIADSHDGLPEVVKRYDTDSNGSIDQQEWLRAVKDYENGLLTNLEIYTISAAR